MHWLLEFDEEDLVANRDLYLTKKQRVQLRNKGRELGFMYGLFVAFIVVGALSVFTHGIKPFFGVTAEVANIILNVAYIALFLIVAIFIGKQVQRPYLEDLKKGDVICLSGKVTPRKESKEYCIFIQHERFKVSKELMQSFSEGALYKIYYVPHSRDIVSAEYVPSETQAGKFKPDAKFDG